MEESEKAAAVAKHREFFARYPYVVANAAKARAHCEQTGEPVPSWVTLVEGWLQECGGFTPPRDEAEEYAAAFMRNEEPRHG